eukprot:1796419-Prymnesium_polylepis.1
MSVDAVDLRPGSFSSIIVQVGAEPGVPVQDREAAQQHPTSRAERWAAGSAPVSRTAHDTQTRRWLMCVLPERAAAGGASRSL